VISRVMRTASAEVDLCRALYYRLVMDEGALNVTFGALADPTRRAILAKLAKGDASVLELAEPFDMSQPAISKHLKVLERAGLIARGRDAQRRPCRLDPRRLKQAADWIGTYRQFWEASYNRLDDYLQELQQKEKPRDVKKTRSHRRTR